MHSTTSAVDFSKETLVVKEEETYNTGVFERVEAEVAKLQEPQSLVEPPHHPQDRQQAKHNEIIAKLVRSNGASGPSLGRAGAEAE